MIRIHDDTDSRCTENGPRLRFWRVLYICQIFEDWNNVRSRAALHIGAYWEIPGQKKGSHAFLEDLLCK